MPERPTNEDPGSWIGAALERHEEPLVSYARRRLGGDLERARDAVQEAFLRLCKERREDVEERLAEWLYTVVRHQTHDVRRKESRMTELSDERMQRRGAGLDPATARVDVKDEAAFVLTALGVLPERQQEALRLKFQHGLTYREIARVTGEPAGTVGWRIHTGIAALRRVLAGEGVQA